MHAVGTLGTEPAARLFTVQSGAQHADGVSNIAALRSYSKMAQRLLAQSMWSSLLVAQHPDYKKAANSPVGWHHCHRLLLRSRS